MSNELINLDNGPTESECLDNWGALHDVERNNIKDDDFRYQILKKLKNGRVDFSDTKDFIEVTQGLKKLEDRHCG